MKDVQATVLPDCDMCPPLGVGVRYGFYNAPTRKDSAGGGRWANLCGPCFELVGIDTSVTERRVLPGKYPMEVMSIARRWSGEKAVVSAQGEGLWTFTWAEDGFRYEVRRPGAETPVFEDSGRPCGTVVLDEWTVRCVNDAPDAWFTVKADGRYVDHRGEEHRVW